ncbi:transporter substrate-binding domain-containing protein [Rhizobium sp. S152]|uniref:transporter substrate-binding domain-containing protein n=1 Tax=Rhizobium sp. S152 TaxID=3055038 RepID=UPI0025A9D943|nr:transporter substrate-binding domain-containing protein [Rhizobium sp. S152]MDM9627691.1 transporter substrate-binding domain-containing protein [Rhizobium sp. S152]
MLRSLLIAVGLSIFAFVGDGDAAPLRVATEGAYPPFNFIEDGELKGFDVDIAKALCAKMAMDCTFLAVPWDDIIEGLEADKYDLVVASMAYTKERADRADFSDPYYRSHSVFIGNEKYQDSSPQALAGVRIAAESGTIQADYLKKDYAKSDILLAADQPAAQRLLIEKKSDLLIGDAIELLTFMETPQGSAYSYVGDPISSDFLQSSAHIAAHRGNQRLIARVNAALKEIKLNGTYDRINDNYFPFNIY